MPQNLPEGFILPTLGNSLGGNVMKAFPAAEAVAGAMGTMCAQIRRHREHNAKKTQELISLGMPGEGKDEIELVEITVDKYTTVPLRGSNLTDPGAAFTCELSVEQQMQLAEMRERFRRNEHGSDTAIANWDVLNIGQQMQLVHNGIMYVEQLAAVPERDYYKLGNGAAALVEQAKRHVQAKTPNKQDEIDRQVSTLLAARAEEQAAREEAEKKYLELQERLAALEGGKPAPKRKRSSLPKPGVQEEKEAA